MPKRVDLPGADELFRPTASKPARPATQTTLTPLPDPTDAPERDPGFTGRIRHDEKITVYVSTDELLALEQLRLSLRAEHGLAVDRGRIVRAAIAEALDDVSENGPESGLIQRLTA